MEEEKLTSVHLGQKELQILTTAMIMGFIYVFVLQSKNEDAFISLGCLISQTFGKTTTKQSFYVLFFSHHTVCCAPKLLIS